MDRSLGMPLSAGRCQSEAVVASGKPTGRSWPGPEIFAINLLAENQPFDSTWHEKSRCNRHGRLMAGWLRSPTAAPESSSSLNLGLAVRPLSGDRYFGFGSGADLGR